MAVRKALEKTTTVNIEDLIDKGARVREDNVTEEKWAHVNLRVPKQLLDSLDKSVKNRAYISRNSWILEAIDEKLQRNEP